MEMRKTVGAIATVVFAASMVACERKEEGTAEQVGREIDAAMQKSAEEMSAASQKMGEAMGKAAEQMGQAANQTGEAMKKAGQEMQKKAEEENHDGHGH
ncbi:MAG: hypothetical protein ACREQJ_17215 [Candidatus Binatia bacterium]